jgi:hypothetical protein
VINISLGNPKLESDHVRKWKAINCADGEKLASMICKNVWSNILWVPNYRSEDYFRCASWLVLDFDEGPSKKEIIEALGKYYVVMGSTKSDGMLKIKPDGTPKPPCDRFRVALKMRVAVWSADQYRYNTKLLAKKYNADLSATDAARKWNPCKEIFYRNDGQLYDPILVVPEDETKKKKKEKLSASIMRHKKNRTLPKRVLDCLAGDIKTGNRNNELIYTAYTLFDVGYSYEQVEKFCRSIPWFDEVKGEVTLKSAAKKNGY